jgi:S1-C subfamily serine protease
MPESVETNVQLLQAVTAPPAPPVFPPAPVPSPASPPAPPSSSSWRRAVAAAAIFAMVLVGGALLGSASRGGSLFSDNASVAPAPSAPSPSISPSQSIPPASGSTGSANQGNSGTTTSGSIAQVSAGLVNITTSLSGGVGEGAGTGMVISSDGEVLTNNHVIANASTINVEIGGDGSTHSAHVIGYDVADDVALVKIDDVSGLDTIPVGNPDNVQISDPIVVLGNALGRGGAPASSAGTVTALGREITATDSDGSNAERLTDMIQVEADVQPGDSGGALVDGNGTVVGMTTAASANGFRFQQEAAGVGFAIRIDKALSIVKQIRNGEEVAGVHVGGRAILGVTLQNTVASPFGSGSSGGGAGALVSGVADDSPAAQAGIEAGDVIFSIGDRTITSTADLQTAMNQYHPGDKAEVGWSDSSGTSHHATVKFIEGAPA